MPNLTRRPSLLEELDDRQDDVLEQLEQLNQRVEDLLNDLIGQRSAEAEAA